MFSTLPLSVNVLSVIDLCTFTQNTTLTKVNQKEVKVVQSISHETIVIKPMLEATCIQSRLPHLQRSSRHSLRTSR